MNNVANGLISRKLPGHFFVWRFWNKETKKKKKTRDSFIYVRARVVQLTDSSQFSGRLINLSAPYDVATRGMAKQLRREPRQLDSVYLNHRGEEVNPLDSISTLLFFFNVNYLLWILFSNLKFEIVVIQFQMYVKFDGLQTLTALKSQEKTN